jgi:hypothetical protein
VKKWRPEIYIKSREGGMKDRRKNIKRSKMERKGEEKGERMKGKKREREDKKGRTEGEVNQTEGRRRNEI